MSPALCSANEGYLLSPLTMHQHQHNLISDHFSRAATAPVRAAACGELQTMTNTTERHPQHIPAKRLASRGLVSCVSRGENPSRANGSMGRYSFWLGP